MSPCVDQGSKMFGGLSQNELVLLQVDEEAVAGEALNCQVQEVGRCSVGALGSGRYRDRKAATPRVQS